MRQYSLSPLFELPNAEEKRNHAYNRRMQEEVMSQTGHEPDLEPTGPESHLKRQWPWMVWEQDVTLPTNISSMHMQQHELPLPSSSSSSSCSVITFILVLLRSVSQAKTIGSAQDLLVFVFGGPSVAGHTLFQ